MEALFASGSSAEMMTTKTSLLVKAVLLALGVVLAGLAICLLLGSGLALSTLLGSPAQFGRGPIADGVYGLFAHDPDRTAIGKDLAFLPLAAYLGVKCFQGAKRCWAAAPGHASS